MPSRLRLSVLLLLLSLPSLVHSQDFSGQVVGITDGDSIHVMHNDRAEKVRLHGIDCPEKKQPFGRRAKQVTSALSFGQYVTVRRAGKDRYGRTLGTVELPNGTNLNYELVRQGWCWWFRKYSPSDTELESLERAARQAKKGLWVDPRPVPPWEYRKAKRSPKNPPPAASHSRASEKRISTAIIGNRDSHLYYRPHCPGYGQMAQEIRIEFASERDAEAAGYHRAWNCP